MLVLSGRMRREFGHVQPPDRDSAGGLELAHHGRVARRPPFTADCGAAGRESARAGRTCPYERGGCRAEGRSLRHAQAARSSRRASFRALSPSMLMKALIRGCHASARATLEWTSSTAEIFRRRMQPRDCVELQRRGHHSSWIAPSACTTRKVEGSSSKVSALGLVYEEKRASPAARPQAARRARGRVGNPAARPAKAGARHRSAFGAPPFPPAGDSQLPSA